VSSEILLGLASLQNERTSWVSIAKRVRVPRGAFGLLIKRAVGLYAFGYIQTRMLRRHEEFGYYGSLSFMAHSQT